jgi:hypothetical protein
MLGMMIDHKSYKKTMVVAGSKGQGHRWSLKRLKKRANI